MLLYVLTDPPEHKIGGTLTEEQQKRCQTQTLLDSPRWIPYPRKGCHVENVCGRFLCSEGGLGAPVLDEEMASAGFKMASLFGLQTEFYHLKGHVTSRCCWDSWVVPSILNHC